METGSGHAEIRRRLLPLEVSGPESVWQGTENRYSQQSVFRNRLDYSQVTETTAPDQCQFRGVSISAPTHSLRQKAVYGRPVSKDEHPELGRWQVIPTEQLGLHPGVDKLRLKFGFDFVSLKWLDWITDEGILALIEAMPIHAVADGDGYLCFGGLITYVALYSHRPTRKDIPVLVHPRVPPEMIARNLQVLVLLAVALHMGDKVWREFVKDFATRRNSYLVALCKKMTREVASQLLSCSLRFVSGK